MLAFEDRAVFEHDRLGEDMFEFADVARPVVLDDLGVELGG